MGGFQKPTEASRRLFQVREAVLALPDGGQLGPFDLDLTQDRRIGVSCAHPSHWDALLAFFTGQTHPVSGVLSEMEPVIVQSDRRLWEIINVNRPVLDYLHSPDIPATVWLEQRRRSVGYLMERMEIWPAMTRRAIKLEPEALHLKFWALRFMLSRAPLLLGSEIFQMEDPAVLDSFRMWWDDFRGSLIACEDGGALPGKVDTKIRTAADGAITVTQVTPET